MKKKKLALGQDLTKKVKSGIYAMSGNSETSCSEPDLCLDDDTSDCFRSGKIGVANNDKILTQIYRIGPFLLINMITMT